MSNPFYDLYNAMKRSEKEVLISGSGSTPQGKNEKNRSGQSYLYKRHGMESEVIEIRLKKKVSGSEANAMISLFDKLDSLRSYEEKQNFSSNKYVRTFCAQLEQLGAECRVSDAIPFITPGDSIIKRETESVVPAI